MRNRSYIGDGVYVSFDGTNVILELETRGRILLNKDNWGALMTFISSHGIVMEGCPVISVPSDMFPTVVEALATLNKDAVPIPVTKN